MRPVVTGSTTPASLCSCQLTVSRSHTSSMTTSQRTHTLRKHNPTNSSDVDRLQSFIEVELGVRTSEHSSTTLEQLPDPSPKEFVVGRHDLFAWLAAMCVCVCVRAMNALLKANGRAVPRALLLLLWHPHAPLCSPPSPSPPLLCQRPHCCCYPPLRAAAVRFFRARCP